MLLVGVQHRLYKDICINNHTKKIQNSFSNCHNAKDDIGANRCYWRLSEELFWLKKSAYLYKNPVKM